MINRFGYITFCDENTNKNNIATVLAYKTGYDTFNDEDVSIYKYNIFTNKIEYYKENDISKISYINLCNIISKALTKDKQMQNIMKYKFSVDSNDKVHIMPHSVIKECFPLPDKNIAYYNNVCYFNITDKLFQKDVTDNLLASVACDHLNNISVLNGFLSDRMFECSCGRIFINLNMFLNSFEGILLIKDIINYKQIANFAKIKIKSLFVKKNKQDITKSDVFDNCNYLNFVIRYHSKTAMDLKDFNLFDIFKNPDEFVNAVNEELDNISKTFESEYLTKYHGLKHSDINYLTYTDVLKLLSNSEFSYSISSYISDVRKIYNSNYSRKVDCIKSDGSVFSY